MYERWRQRRERLGIALPSTSEYNKKERRASSVERRASSVERRASSVERRASSVERRASSVERRASSVERRASSVSPLADLSPPRRGGRPSTETASGAGRSPGPARPRPGRRSPIRSGRALATVALLALSGALALPAAAQTDVEHWSATLTRDHSVRVSDGSASSANYGYSEAGTEAGVAYDAVGALDPSTFTYGSVSYTVQRLFVSTSNSIAVFQTSPALPNDADLKLRLPTFVTTTAEPCLAGGTEDFDLNASSASASVTGEYGWSVSLTCVSWRRLAQQSVDDRHGQADRAAHDRPGLGPRP